MISRNTPLLLTDLDGTLIVGRDTLSGRPFARLVQLLTAHGGNVVIATARPPHDVVRLLGPSASHFSVICSDGGIHFDCLEGSIQDIHNEICLSPTDVASAVSALRKSAADLDIILFASSAHGFEVRVLPGADLNGEQAVQALTRLDDQRPRRVYVATDDATFNEVRGVAVLAREERSSAIAASAMSRTTAVQWLVYRETRLLDTPQHSWIEAVPHGMSKGAAAAHLARSASVVIAAGNGLNDLPLFDIAGVSFCPSDSDAAVRAVADYVLDAPGGQPFLEALHCGLLRLLHTWTESREGDKR